MRILGYLIRKELLQLSRDRTMLPLVFIAPVLQLVLLGYAANLDVREIPTVIVDRDNTSLSRKVSEAFVNSRYFAFTAAVQTPQEADELLSRGTVSVAVSIPKGFARAIFRGERTAVQLLADGTNATVGTAATNYARFILLRFQRDMQKEKGTQPISSRPVAVETRSQVLYNPTMETRNFMVPGILALLLMVITMVLSSLAIVKEKELGTLEQLNVTPLKPTQMVIGKLIPFGIIGIVDIFLVLGVSQFIFAVPFRGSFLLLFGVSLLFLVTTLGLGLLVSTVSSTQQQAMLTASFFVMIPMLFLSGFAFPLETMPRAIQYVSYLLPLRYYLVIIRGIFLKGAGLVDLWDQVLALVIFGVTIITLATLRVRKRI